MASFFFAAAVAAGPVHAPQLSKPIWISKPTGEMLARVYPSQAVRESAGAAVALRCVLGPDGRAASCRVLGQTPSPYDFTSSALALTNAFQVSMGSGPGEGVVGEAFALKIRFCTSDTSCHGPVLNVWPGDAAFLVSIHDAKSGFGSAQFACPSTSDPARRCDLHDLDWRERPDEQLAADILADTDQLDGKSMMECRAAPDGSLSQCKVANAGPRATAALLRLASAFRAPATTRDGRSVANGHILFEVDWRMIHAMLFPDAATG